MVIDNCVKSVKRLYLEFNYLPVCLAAAGWPISSHISCTPTSQHVYCSYWGRKAGTYSDGRLKEICMDIKKKCVCCVEETWKIRNKARDTARVEVTCGILTRPQHFCFSWSTVTKAFNEQRSLTDKGQNQASASSIVLKTGYCMSNNVSPHHRCFLENILSHGVSCTLLFTKAMVCWI